VVPKFVNGSQDNWDIYLLTYIFVCTVPTLEERSILAQQTMECLQSQFLWAGAMGNLVLRGPSSSMVDRFFMLF